MTPLTRRSFLTGSAALLAVAGFGKFQWRQPPAAPVSGRIVGASSAIGHKLRDGFFFPAPSRTLQKKAVMIGGGIAGLSAAWKLKKSGFHDFIVLELEKEVGGNAAYGENTVSSYPWGAHYVPLLNPESTAAHEMFQDLGVITGYESGQPVYDEYYLGADPHERLFIHGSWQAGLVPRTGIGGGDQEQYRDFFARMEAFKQLKGKDGKRAFAIPVDKSSADPDIRALDTFSMKDYMHRNGWDSTYLAWYIDYCCRDDYGANAEQVSAWAGIHYFAGRFGKAANAAAGSVVTWSEGNGWIVKQLKRQLADHLCPDALAFEVSRNGDGATVSYVDTATGQVTEIHTECVVFATPRFVAEKLMPTGMEMDGFHYSPWMVANVTLDAMPQGKGAPLAWDNMIYDSQLLGYVVATHQQVNRVQRETVLTYYWPLSHLAPKQARKWMIHRTYEEWRDIVLKELLHVHPELRSHVKRLDIWLWGHGMIQPDPGFLWGETRQEALKQAAPFFYAHSDMSGISIFEEANHHGVAAAESVMRHLHHLYRSSL